MNNFFKILIFFIFLLCCFNFDALSQSEKLKKAQKELDQTRELLSSLNKKTTKTYLRYKLLEKQINLQQILLVNIKAGIDSLDKKIVFNTNKRKELVQRVRSLKGEYENLILYAYKTRNTRNKTIYIFSSKSFNQAYRRFVYLQYLAEYLEQTTLDLSKQSDSLQFLNESLRIQKEQKMDLKEKQTDELLKLHESKTILAGILKNLNSRKDELLAEIREKEKIALSIRKSIRKNVAKTNVTTKTKLSVNFEKNRGRLPFPIEGIIASSFGKHTHSVLKNVTIENDGIEIASAKGAKAKAIHPGIVSQVLKIPGAKNAVIIKHGQYYTVYSNLDQVYVNKGENIETGQNIGIPFSRILNFQIWYQNKKLNPQKWLRI